jgi:hypothetical protein
VKHVKIKITKKQHEYGGRLVLELSKGRVLAEMELESDCGGDERQGSVRGKQPVEEEEVPLAKTLTDIQVQAENSEEGFSNNYQTGK